MESHAQGRVWLGAQALERRLVDKLGGLDDALAEARRRAGIPAAEKIRVLEYRRPRGGLIERVVGGWVRETIARETRLPEPGESRFEAELPVEP
jgi:ClpP class serine protease